MQAQRGYDKKRGSTVISWCCQFTKLHVKLLFISVLFDKFYEILTTKIFRALAEPLAEFIYFSSFIGINFAKITNGVLRKTDRERPYDWLIRCSRGSVRGRRATNLQSSNIQLINIPFHLKYDNFSNFKINSLDFFGLESRFWNFQTSMVG